MRRVVSDSEVAHFFANQTQSDATTPNRNFHFNGDTIYSSGSHFPIAKHVTNSKGEKGLLFTTRTYSSTTSKHVGTVSWATNHLNTIYCCNPDATHTDNLKNWKDLIEEQLQKLARANKPIIYTSQIARLKEQIIKYINFWDISLDLVVGLEEAMNISDKDSGKVYDSKRQERIAEANARYAEQQRLIKIKEEKEFQVKLKDWRKFKINKLWGRYDYDYLRFNTLNERFETSQGIEIPEEIGKRFYKFILKTIENGGCVECDYKILDFKVTSINKDYLKVGCHKISMKEIKSIVKTLNW